MKIVRIKKKYRHNARRTWNPGDTPTISGELAAKLEKEGVAEILSDRDVLDTRGITQDELDDAIEEAKRQEQEYKKEEKPKKTKS